MTKFLLKFALSAFLERIKDEFDREMDNVEPQRRRVWNEFILFRLKTPEEGSPEDQWHWEEFKDVPDELTKFANIISDFEAFIEAL